MSSSNSIEENDTTKYIQQIKELTENPLVQNELIKSIKTNKDESFTDWKSEFIFCQKYSIKILIGN